MSHELKIMKNNKRIITKGQNSVMENLEKEKNILIINQ